MTDYEAIKATLDSPGARVILRKLHYLHRKMYLQYRQCETVHEMNTIQAKQYGIECLPVILNELMNEHLTKQEKAIPGNMFKFWEWFRKAIR